MIESNEGPSDSILTSFPGSKYPGNEVGYEMTSQSSFSLLVDERQPKFSVRPVKMQNEREDQTFKVSGTNGQPSEILHFLRWNRLKCRLSFPLCCLLAPSLKCFFFLFFNLPMTFKTVFPFDTDRKFQAK